jgi:hypothetical protein
MTTRKAEAAGLRLVDGLHPIFRDETAKDGAPALLWLGEVSALLWLAKRKKTTADPLRGMTTRKAKAEALRLAKWEWQFLV